MSVCKEFSLWSTPFMFCGLTRFCPWFCWRILRSKPSNCISSSLECGIQRCDIHDTIFSGCAILWAASVHLVNACKKNPWDKKNSLEADSLRWEWSHSQGCRHTQKKKTTLGRKTLDMVSLILETLQCYYCQPKVDWTSVIINQKKKIEKKY